MLKVGCIQFAPQLGNLEATQKILSGLVSKVKDADLLVLPELCNSGYNFINRKQAWESSAQINESSFINYLTQTCQQYNLHIISGFNERLGNDLFNSAVLVGPNGFIGKYQKLHLFNTEKDFFKPGETGLPVFDVGKFKIGIQVCFDWMYPEAWRVLTLKGANIICHPSNLVLPGLAQKAVPVHAMINRIFTITANRIGKEGNLRFTGLSTIANPKGEIIAQASDLDNEILLVDIDPQEASDKWVTDRNHLLTDRRPEKYTTLSEIN
jgi:predicted amidohydrolase